MPTDQILDGMFFLRNHLTQTHTDINVAPLREKNPLSWRVWGWNSPPRFADPRAWPLLLQVIGIGFVVGDGVQLHEHVESEP